MVFILYLDGVHRCGSDFTFIHQKRKTSKITENEKRWAKSIKEFYGSASVKVVSLDYNTWKKSDPKDFAKYALDVYIT